MGTTRASGPVVTSTCSAESGGRGITTTLCASFEFPLRLQSTDGVAVAVAPSGDATFLQNILRDKTDWPAAQKHREQLSAVMPEMDVVGCYVVCASSRWTSTRHPRGGDDRDGSQLSVGGAVKKAKGEAMAGADHIAAIANCVQQQLRSTSILPSTATGFVLLVVYDKEVTSAAGDTDTAAPNPPHSPAAARLPFDCLYVPATTASDASPTEEVTVGPSDMEWIALANETMMPAYHQSSTTTCSAAVKPGLLRRLCSAAYLTSEGPDSREPANTQTSRMASSQNCRAAEELVGSLRLIMRVLVEMTASTLSPTGTAPDDVELLRTVATCLRNVPVSHPSQPPGEPRAPSELPTEEMLSAILALEVQCALHMRSLSKAQQQLLSSSRSAMTAFHSKACSPKAANPPPPLPSAEGWSTHERDKRSGVNTAVPGHGWV
ncbi:conserved hypothetical protein [Leishmania major strain Friedlin]|uniref:Uncharacterized protein n=1 Tax=Leishmania major TaxID=5664 RepID=Q4QHI3_LEIMA|nr:conserved hypothetical protein [Leishmania major strain Friedlin]CAG9570009.1 hypothetical_protein_-_conserved [Leishmania major strain Friedlin]CAJ02505.1 conserved hypothetical protein [Leishmania major strain Friedlin]|eukprot:XP_001681365.1 conserved hypothetical protein [Leishmania major strain Friedlin]